METLFNELHPEENFFVSPAMVLAWCEGKRSWYYFVANQLCVARQVDSHNKGIAFHWADQHMYLYNSTQWCAAKTASTSVRSPAAIKLPCSKIVDTPVSTEWKLVDKLQAGYYGSVDLEDTRG